MSDEQPPIAENMSPESADDPNSRPGNDRPAAGWQMPKPVFKKTSGYLPQGFEKLVGSPEVSVPAAGVDPPMGAIEPENVHVVAQPDLSEHLLPDEEPAAPTAAVPKKQKSIAGRIVFGVFFLMVAFILIAAFLYIVVTLFFSS